MTLVPLLYLHAFPTKEDNFLHEHITIITSKKINDSSIPSRTQPVLKMFQNTFYNSSMLRTTGMGATLLPRVSSGSDLSSASFQSRTFPTPFVLFCFLSSPPLFFWWY